MIRAKIDQIKSNLALVANMTEKQGIISTIEHTFEQVEQLEAEIDELNSLTREELREQIREKHGLEASHD